MTTKRNAQTRKAASIEARDAKVLEIARRLLRLETLEARNMDGLDFSEQGVWCLKEALEAAYAAGKKAAEKDMAKDDTTAASEGEEAVR
jgi:hypothetical protein